MKVINRKSDNRAGKTISFTVTGTDYKGNTKSEVMEFPADNETRSLEQTTEKAFNMGYERGRNDLRYRVLYWFGDTGLSVTTKDVLDYLNDDDNCYIKESLFKDVARYHKDKRNR